MPIISNSSIITLILTNNRIEYLPSCFSQASIENLVLNSNPIQFNQTTILSNSKLLHLDLSSNNIPYLPPTFFSNLRRLRRFIIDGTENLFKSNNDPWLRSLTTHNQLTLIICTENFHLSLCLFDYLFKTKKLLAIELNKSLHCDCSFVYLPIEKIHFDYCQSAQLLKTPACNNKTSRFKSFQYLQTYNEYHQICLNQYEICQNKSFYKEFYLPLNKNLIVSTHNSTRNQTITTTTTTTTRIFSRKENITAGAIIALVLVLFVVSIICLYVILSGHLFNTKNRDKMMNLINRKKRQQDFASVDSLENTPPTKFDECIPIENFNMNFNLQPINSYSDDESELTFYSIIQDSSLTVLDNQSLLSTSTINSSESNETVIIISNRNKPQRIH